MTSHLKRWLTAIIAVPLLLAIIFYGSDAVFSATIIIVILAGVSEYHQIVFGAGHLWEKAETLVIGFLIPLAVYLGDMRLLLALLSFSVLLVFFTYLLRIHEEKFDILPVGKLILGFMYVPLMMSYFILIRRFDQGFSGSSFCWCLPFPAMWQRITWAEISEKEITPPRQSEQDGGRDSGSVYRQCCGVRHLPTDLFSVTSRCSCGRPGFFRKCDRAAR